MSQDNKGSRTMIGTVAPVTRPGTSGFGTQPPGATPTTPVPGQVPAQHGQPGQPAHPGQHGQPYHPGPPSQPYPQQGQHPSQPGLHPSQPPGYAPPPSGQYAGQPPPLQTPPPGSLGAPTIIPTGSIAPGQLPNQMPGHSPHTPPPQGWPSSPGLASGHVADHLGTHGPDSANYLPPGYAAGNEADVFVGQELCGYTIRRKLAEGGMGVVYEGEHTTLGRRGAIKVLKLEFCRNEEVVERFKQEARAVNAIRHENIVDISDFGRDQYGRVFFVMEFLEGEPLSTRIRRGALAWAEAFPILDQMLRALKAAHDKGFVHRDLKPDNIWLQYVEGRVQVKLLDFGIAKLVGTDSPKEKLTQTGSVIGTPHYMSPEQINGSRDVDHRTDIYALGVIMYEMFAGVTPFVGDTLQAVMTGHLFKEPPRLADIPAVLGVPGPVAEVVARMLVKDANARYDSVGHVLADLHDVNRNQRPANAETLQRMRPVSVVAAPGALIPPAGVQGHHQPAKRGSKKGLVIAGVLIAAAAAAAVVVVTKKSESGGGGAVAVDPTGKGGSAGVPETPTPTAPPAPPTIDPTVERDSALAVLRSSLREAEPLVRVQGTDTVAKIKDEKSIPELTAMTEKDADELVRGHTAEALGTLGASATAELLGKLEAAAPAPLKVWYASALARMGDAKAVKRLYTFARDKDLAISFKATVTLADISQPGDKKAIAALKALASHEAQLNEIQPYAGAMILTKMAALRDPTAYKLLYSLLENSDEGAQLAAAEGLARLGDDAGKAVLQQVAGNKSSPNQLVAAVAQIPLGEYGGLGLITEKLSDKDPETQRLAARALGEIGEKDSLRALIALNADAKQKWPVRIAAAGAIVSIVGLDPVVLAQASVDWTKGALDSQDWAVRKAAAGVLADLPAKEAVPLLAQAIADEDPKVRLAASRSASKIKTPEAAKKVIDAVAAEKDPAVKEQQVVALGEMGQAEAKETLKAISEEPGRIGVIAAGSRIALGDEAAKDKLETAVQAPATEMRLAAVQAASAANNKVVLPTLKIGAGDKIFEVQFAAAEGLSQYQAEKDAAVPILTKALKSKDTSLVGRALAALTRLGAKTDEAKLSPEEMIGSADPQQRLAAVPVVKAMPVAERVPLLRRLVADSNEDVRRAGVDAIEGVAESDKDQAIKLYKPLVNNADVVVRSKASGQLAKLVVPEAPKQPAVVTPPPEPTPPPPPPAVDDTLPKAQQASAAVPQALDDLKNASAALEKAIGEAAELKKNADDKDDLEEAAGKLKAELKGKREALDAALARVDAAEQGLKAVATPSPEAKKVIDAALATLQTGRTALGSGSASLSSRTDEARASLDKLGKGDSASALVAARLALSSGDLAAAQANLNKATKALRDSGDKDPTLDFLYGQLYDGRADNAPDGPGKKKLQQQAVASFKRFLSAGAGSARDKKTAAETVKRIQEELK